MALASYCSPTVRGGVLISLSISLPSIRGGVSRDSGEGVGLYFYFIMQLFDVYPLFNINIVKGQGCHIWDDNGQEYLDFYGGHAVISIGHCHPHYVEMMTKQLNTLGFYSNSVINKLQVELAHRLGKACGYDD